MKIKFKAPNDFKGCNEMERDCAAVAAGAELLMTTAKRVAGERVTAKIISMTTELLDQFQGSQVIGIGSISLMGANIAFMEGHLMSNGAIFSRLTGSCRMKTDESYDQSGDRET